MKNPTAPASKNQGKSFFEGNFIFVIKAMQSRTQEAIKYLKNPREKDEKYCNVSLVNTYANDQNTIVIIAYG